MWDVVVEKIIYVINLVETSFHILPLSDYDLL